MTAGRPVEAMRNVPVDLGERPVDAQVAWLGNAIEERLHDLAEVAADRQHAVPVWATLVVEVVSFEEASGYALPLASSPGPLILRARAGTEIRP